MPGQFLPGLYTIPVRISDINYGNHAGNDSIISIIHESRMQWITQHNYTELDIEGAGLIMADLAIEFNNESFYGDRIQIKIAVGEISKVSFELYYLLTVARESEITIAKAKTGMVCYDYRLKKITCIPPKLINILTALV